MRRVFRFFLTVLSGPFLVVLYLNIETYAQSRGWDGLLSRHFPAVSDFLLQTWVIVLAALFAGAAIGAWTHSLLSVSEAPEALSSSTLQGSQLPEIVYDTKWANGIPTMPIQDVACALAGITRESYAASARAQALATDLVEATYDGWVCSQEAHMHLINNIGNFEVRVEGKPQFPGVEKATIETRIYTPSLREDYLLKRPDLNVDWIPEQAEGNPMTVTIGVR